MEPMNVAHLSTWPPSGKPEELTRAATSSSAPSASSPSDPFDFDMDELFAVTPPNILQNIPTRAPVLRVPDAAIVVTPASPVQSKKQDEVSSPTSPDKPKRPLSAYNIFFKFQRKRILAVMPVRASGKPRRSHGKMGFADMARAIAGKWKTITPQEKAVYAELAAVDKRRYIEELKEWKKTSASEGSNVDPSVCAIVNGMPELLLAPTPIITFGGEYHHLMTNRPQAPGQLTLMRALGLDGNGPSMHNAFSHMASLSASAVVSNHPPCFQNLFQGFPPSLVPAAALPPVGSAADDNEIASLATSLGREGCDFMVDLFRNT